MSFDPNTNPVKYAAHGVIANKQSALLTVYPWGRTDIDILTEPPTLAQLQAATDAQGGYLEAVPCGGRHEAYCHEEGKLRGMAPNPYATSYLGVRGDILVGKVAILIGVRVDDDGDFVLDPEGGSK